MPSVFTIQGVNPRRRRRKSRGKRKGRGRSGLGKSSRKNCKCVYNPKTGRYSELCRVGKSKKHPSGWSFQKGGARRCER